MNVASLELCKELYELSEWGADGVRVAKYRKNGFLVTWGYMRLMKGEIPAYDLGYLLRKLPAQFGKRGSNSAECLRLAKDKDRYLAGYIGVDLVWGFPCEADTPEDAACKLAIELFKQGVLKP